MNSRFDDLWTTAADDGASCPVGVYATQPEGGPEVDQLLNAWYRERTERIECSLLLDEAARLIRHLLDDGPVSTRRRRQAGRLLRTIRAAQKNKGEGEAL